LKEKIPICKWGILPDGIMYKGKVPPGYNLAIVPGPEYIILDVDRHKDKDGFKYIPDYPKAVKFVFKIFRIKKLSILDELEQTFNYKTKNNGKHYWLKYTGNKVLGNKTSGFSSDLRTDKGYVAYWYDKPIEECLHLIKETSPKMNEYLERLFSYKNKK